MTLVKKTVMMSGMMQDFSVLFLVFLTSLILEFGGHWVSVHSNTYTESL